MSSDDDPATDAVFVHPKDADASSAQSSRLGGEHLSSANANLPSKSATQTSDDGPGSSFPSAPGSASSRSKDFWHTDSLTSEPSSLMESSQNSFGHAAPRPSRWTKARSTSTESSLSLSGIAFGSTYNQDGFPNYPATSEEEHLAMDDAAIAKQVALTDEAVRVINGTASVVQAGSLGMPTHMANTYELPRSMAAFVRRPGDGTGERDLRTGRSFVSSGSSTSSEESEHLASVQWVATAVAGTTPQLHYSPYPRPIVDPPPRPSPSMPPPSSTHNRPQSPRRNNPHINSTNNSSSNNGTPISSGSGNGHTPTPGGFSAPRPPTVTTSQPTITSTEGSPDNNNEDDEQTVGGMREGSPSSSSASGLDLLSHAAAHHERHERTRYSSSVRRKAGAEAVAQWRESGIPSGSPRIGEAMIVTPGYDALGYESTPSAEGSTQPSKKRRKSNMMETPDAKLRKLSNDGDEQGADGGSDYGSEVSAGDSEYRDAKGRKRSNGGRGKKPRIRATLLIPQATQNPGKQSPTTPKKTGAKASTPTSGKSAAARRDSDANDAALKAGGVQCGYFNPLPPYQQCPDVFTRKYDIPRHTARHARREGDLVAEGKLPEEKAVLWMKNRDKPKIRCETCGEYFTRQDALKRHQTKQHH